MQKKIIIDGMSCQKCANNIKNTLLKLDKVIDVVVFLETNEAIVDINGEIANDLIIEAIEYDNKYHVKSIEDGTYKMVQRVSEDKIKLINRMKRLIGQMNGIAKMIEDDRYCDDILIQLSAVDKAIKSIANTILDEHIHTCLVRDIKQDKYEILDEITNLFRRFQ